jgi:D-alanyl-D-alanine carboxypeptidase
MKYLPAILIAVAILLAPLVWHLSRGFFAPVAGPGGSLIDDTARIELERLRAQVAVLRERIEKLETQTLGAIQAPRPVEEDPASDTQVSDLLRSTENTIADDYPKVVSIENRRQINPGLTVPDRDYLIEVLGMPRDTLSDTCQEITNPEFAAGVVTEQVGNITVRMQAPALESLKRVFALIQAVDNDLYERIDTAGALCVRRIRGSSSAISSHSFGLAIDLNIDGQLDTLGDGKTQLGLTIIADIFQREGWYWGAGFGREDSMHFEVSKELLEQWRAQGKI